MRKPLAFVVFLAAPLVYLARRRNRSRERVSLYYADGSMVTLPRGSAQAERLLALARDAR